MQDGKEFFSQKTTENSFPRWILSFLMGVIKERYDFIRRGFDPVRLLWRRRAECGTIWKSFPEREDGPGMEKHNQTQGDSQLHGREERVKRIFRDQIAEAAGILEVVLSGIVLVGLLLSVVPLVQWMPGLITDGNEVEVYEFLTRALDIVIGIEFIKMLAKHSPGSVLEVLLYAIARHMIVGHEDAVQNLVSVVAIALIFIIRRFFFVPSFGQKLPGGQLAPDVAHLYAAAEEGDELGETHGH